MEASPELGTWGEAERLVHPTDHTRRPALGIAEAGGLEEGHGAEHGRQGLVAVVQGRLLRIAVLTTTLIGVAVSGSTSLRLV